MIILGPLINVISIALEFYMWLVIASALLSWLVAFNVVNTSNRFVHQMGSFLYRITEPALRPIRHRVIPSFGGIDISPVILILAIYFIQQVLFQVYASLIQSGAG